MVALRKTVYGAVTGPQTFHRVYGVIGLLRMIRMTLTLGWSDWVEWSKVKEPVSKYPE